MNRKLSLVTLIILVVVIGLIGYGFFRGRRFGGAESRPSLAEGNTASPSPWRDRQLDQWSRFRGPNGSGTINTPPLAEKWDDEANVIWKSSLPGPGGSSPILTADRVFVTCYSGYGVDRREPGQIEDLKRHLVCLDRSHGDILWQKTFPAVQPESPFSGNGLPEHGYATSTPTTDGQYVFVFLGKSGLYAFDMEGKEQWFQQVGDGLNPKGWGSCSSPILYNDLVIVNAAEESSALIAFRKSDGEEVWRAESPRLPFAFTTPVLVPVTDDRTDLVMPVMKEVWGLNPATGKLQWFCESPIGGNVSPVPIVQGDHVYCFGGFQDDGSLCIRAGGQGDVTNTHVEWTSRETSYIASPVLFDSTLYWVDGNFFLSMDAATGQRIEKQRLPSSFGNGRITYASPVLVDDRIYIQTRNSGVAVVRAQPELELISQNQFRRDNSTANATPAISDGRLYLRTNQNIYCIGMTD